MTTQPTEITPSQSRQTVRVQMLDGSYWDAPNGTPLEVYFKRVYPEMVPSARPAGAPDECTVIAALVDGLLRELSYPISRDTMVRPVLLSDSDGLRIYRRSLSFLLIVAAEELFPGRQITIDHSLPFGGMYCSVINDNPFTPAELEQIRTRMRQIVAEDAPIVRRIVPLDEALALFRERGDDDKVRLMESRKKDYLVLYELHGMREYFYGYMTPSTGYLTTFDLAHDGEGFVLQHPRRSEPDKLQPISALPKLRNVFYESSKWLRLLGVPNIGALNQAIREGHARELILVAEALHEGRFADMADAIIARQPEVRLVLIAGPSSAGKTTSSKRLAIQLMAHGLKPYPIGLDNYFVDRDKTPIDEKGEFDYEHLHAVELDLFNDHLLRLMDGQEVWLPRYNFLTGRREEGDIVQLTPEHIIIVEGIHGLNSELIPAVPHEKVFRLYISCLTQLNIDRHNRVPTTDVRLLRRMVRDAATRGYSAQQTLARWRSVREGEQRWIFPYQENADIMFNSSLVYELAILGPLVEPLLLQIEPGTSHYVEAKRVLAFLGWVESLKNVDLVPDNSLLREFIGKSILRDYTPGSPNIESGE